MKIGKPEFLMVNKRTRLIESHTFESAGGRVEHFVEGVHRASVAAVHFPDYVAAMDCATECQFTPDKPMIAAANKAYAEHQKKKK